MFINIYKPYTHYTDQVKFDDDTVKSLYSNWHSGLPNHPLHLISEHKWNEMAVACAIELVETPELLADRIVYDRPGWMLLHSYWDDVVRCIIENEPSLSDEALVYKVYHKQRSLALTRRIQTNSERGVPTHNEIVERSIPLFNDTKKKILYKILLRQITRSYEWLERNGFIQTLVAPPDTKGWVTSCVNNAHSRLVDSGDDHQEFLDTLKQAEYLLKNAYTRTKFESLKDHIGDCGCDNYFHFPRFMQERENLSQGYKDEIDRATKVREEWQALTQEQRDAIDEKQEKAIAALFSMPRPEKCLERDYLNGHEPVPA